MRGIRIVVQSERSPAYLEQRVDAFLDEMKETIEKMPEDEWEAQKEGLKHKWVEKHKNMSEETNSYWPHIDSGYLDFLRRKSLMVSYWVTYNPHFIYHRR